MVSAQALQDCISVVDEVIRARQSNGNSPAIMPSPSEYFAVISTLLSSGLTEEKTALLLKLFAAVIPLAAPKIVRSQFKSVSQALSKVIDAALVTRDESVLSLGLESLGALLVQQDTSDGFWAGVPALHSVNILLMQLDAESPRIRRIAHSATLSLLQKHRTAGSNGLRSYITDFFLGAAKATSRANYRRVHCIVVFMESGLSLFNETAIRRIIDASLRLKACGIPRLISAVYRMIDTLFQNTIFVLTNSCARSILTTLMSSTPGTEDVEAICYYVSCLSSGFALIVKLNREDANGMLKRLLTILAVHMSSEFTQVHTAVAVAFKRASASLFTDSSRKNITEWFKLLPPDISFDSICKALSSSRPNIVESLCDVTSLALELLTMNFKSAWTFSLDCAKSVFAVLRGCEFAFVFGQPLLSRLGELYNALDTKIVTVADQRMPLNILDAIGEAMPTIGLKHFLDTLPILETGDDRLITRDWVITALRRTLGDSSNRLSDFVTGILPIAKAFHQLVAKMSAESVTGKEKHIKLLRDKVIQIWSLFPEFCAGRVMDVRLSLPRMISIFENVYPDEEYPELGHFITLGLSRLLMHEYAAENKATFEAVAPQLLPLLLKTIENLDLGDGKFKETLDCITSLVSVSSAALVVSVTKQLLRLVLLNTSSDGSIEEGKLSKDNGDNHQAEAAGAWMAVLLAMVPSIPPPMASIMYRTVKPLLTLGELGNVQKRSYQLLNALIISRGDVIYSEEPRTALLQMLSESLLTAHVSSRNMRLRCLNSILNSMDDTTEIIQAFESLQEEVVACLKDANKKTRDQAADILRVFSQKLPALPVLETYQRGLHAERTLAKSAAVCAICIHLVEKCTTLRNRNAAKQSVGDESSDGSADDDSSREEEDEEEDLEQKLQEFSDLCSAAVSLIPEMNNLISNETADQTKAALSFLKVLCVVATREQLQGALPLIIHAIFTEVASLKAKFSSRSRAILRKLLRKFDSEELRPFFPEGDVPLLDYISRISRKALRRRLAQREAAGHRPLNESGKMNPADYDQLMGSDSDDESDVKVEENAGKQDDDDDIPVEEDYRLQRGRKLRVSRAEPISNAERKASSGRVVPLSSTLSTSGALMAAGLLASSGDGIEDLNPSKRSNAAEDRFDVVITAEGKFLIKEKEIDSISQHTKRDTTDSVGANTAGVQASSRLALAMSKREEKNKKRKFNLREPGAEYRSKNAGGDVWRKGVALQPHAYIPLDPRLLSKKHQDTAVEHFGKVVSNNKQQRKKQKSHK